MAAVSQLLLGRFGFRRVAADEEMPLLRLGPHAGPGQHYDTAVLMEGARVEVTRFAPATRRSHLIARPIKISAMDKFGCAVADHFLGLVTENCCRAWADPRKVSVTVRDQDKIKSCIKNAATLFDLVHPLLMLNAQRLSQLHIHGAEFE